MKLNDFAKELERIFDIDSFGGADVSLNGLQVGDGEKEIRKAAFAVDASLASIREAAKRGADVLFVHHGLFWGRPVAITGQHYERIKLLLDNGLALFACHLPLDAHSVYGNNARMAKKLGLSDVKTFSLFRGVYVGFKGILPKPMDAEGIIKTLGVRTNPTNFMINPQKTFSKVGIVSGDGAGDVYQAMEEGLDVLITGESSYSTVNDCIENNMGMMCIGHYETETFGVKAVMELVSERFGLETCFVDIPLGL
ncbi:MAG: Nif3-like dinuclear metal center hexameric protein [Sphaerochaeta sp.]